MAPSKQNVNLELTWLNKHPFKGRVFNNMTNCIIQVQNGINRDGMRFTKNVSHRWDVKQSILNVRNTHNPLLGMGLKYSFVVSWLRITIRSLLPNKCNMVNQIIKWPPTDELWELEISNCELSTSWDTDSSWEDSASSSDSQGNRSWADYGSLSQESTILPFTTSSVHRPTSGSEDRLPMLRLLLNDNTAGFMKPRIIPGFARTLQPITDDM